MRLACPTCKAEFDIPEPASDEPIVCPVCRSAFDAGGRARTTGPLDDDADEEPDAWEDGLHENTERAIVRLGNAAAWLRIAAFVGLLVAVIDGALLRLALGDNDVQFLLRDAPQRQTGLALG